MLLEKIKEKLAYKQRFNIKQFSADLGGVFGWILILCLCLAVSLFSVSQIGIWTRSVTISDGYTALTGLKNMSLLSYFDGSFFEAISELNQNQITAVAKMLMLFMFVAYILFVVFYVTYHFITHRYKWPKSWMTLRRGTMISAGVLFITVLNFILETVIILATVPGSQSESALEAANALSTSGNPFLVLLTSGVLAPVVEEILFRKGIQRAISKYSPLVSLIFTSIVFGLLHGNIIQSVFAMIMGFALGLVYELTGNLVYSISMHVAVNISGCLISLLCLPEIMFYFIFALIPFFLFIILLICYKRNNKARFNLG